MSSPLPTSTSTTHCYIDFDIDGSLASRSRAAEFVNATDSRYGFTSKDLIRLGGSELNRLQEFYANDHEWSDKGPIQHILPTQNTRIVVRLFDDLCPLTCQNFVSLCVGPASATSLGSCGKPLHYKNSTVHRVQRHFVVQAGDFVFGNGSGGESVHGKKFKDEKNGLLMMHDRRGVLSMGNSGKNSNTSQFFITFGNAPACDGKHVVFGEVVLGPSFDVLDALEKHAGSDDGTPRVPVAIADCGKHEDLPRAGYWLNVPSEEYLGYTPVFYAFPVVLVIAPSGGVGEKFKQAFMSAAFCVVHVLVQGNTVAAERVAGVDLVVVAKASKEVAEEEWAVASKEKVVVGAPGDIGGFLARFRDLGWVLDERTC